MSGEYTTFGAKKLKPKKERLPLTRTQKVLGVTGFLVLAIAVFAIVASILPTQAMKESDFIAECNESIKRQLKDPESAQIEDPWFGVIADKTDDGDDDFSMSGVGRARNGFGGMTSFTYECNGGYSKTADRVFGSARLNE